MLLKKCMTSDTKSDEEYINVLKKREKTIIIIMILGAASFICSIIFSKGSYAYLSDFQSGLYAGIGAGTIVGSLILYWNIRKLKKDERKLHEKRLEEQDERRRMILWKGFTATSVAMFFMLFVGMLISGIINMTVFWTLWTVLMISFGIFMLNHAFYNNKY